MSPPYCRCHECIRKFTHAVRARAYRNSIRGTHVQGHQLGHRSAAELTTVERRKTGIDSSVEGRWHLSYHFSIGRAPSANNLWSVVVGFRTMPQGAHLRRLSGVGEYVVDAWMRRATHLGSFRSDVVILASTSRAVEIQPPKKKRAGDLSSLC